MYVKVIKYNKHLDYHVCEDSEGNTIHLDFFTHSSDLLENKTPENLVGKTIYYERHFPLMYIAMNILKIEEN